MEMTRQRRRDEPQDQSRVNRWVFRARENCSVVVAVLTFGGSHAVASLGWVTPGAATEGVTPLFFPEKPSDLSSRHFCGVTPDFFFAKTDDLFCSSLYRFLLLSLGCHPLEGVTLHLFYLSDLASPLFFVNLPTKFFSFGCHPLEGVTRGGPPPHPRLVTPLKPRSCCCDGNGLRCLCGNLVFFCESLVSYLY